MLVDLFTTSRELEDIMIQEYPGLIFEDQYKADNSDPDEKIYCFYDLDYRELLGFLWDKKAREKYDFEIRGSENGKFVEVNKLRCQN